MARVFYDSRPRFWIFHLKLLNLKRIRRLSEFREEATPSNGDQRKLGGSRLKLWIFRLELLNLKIPERIRRLSEPLSNDSVRPGQGHGLRCGCKRQFEIPGASNRCHHARWVLISRNSRFNINQRSQKSRSLWLQRV